LERRTAAANRHKASPPLQTGAEGYKKSGKQFLKLFAGNGLVYSLENYKA
jgi:hypothetical protein